MLHSFCARSMVNIGWVEDEKGTLRGSGFHRGGRTAPYRFRGPTELPKFRYSPHRCQPSREGQSHRGVARDGHPMHRATLRKVIRNRVVLHRAIVPECDRVLAPSEAALILGNRRAAI